MASRQAKQATAPHIRAMPISRMRRVAAAFSAKRSAEPEVMRVAASSLFARHRALMPAPQQGVREERQREEDDDAGD